MVFKLIRKCIKFIIKFLNSNNLNNDDLKRRAYILNVILSFFFALSLYAFASWIYHYIANTNRHLSLINLVSLVIFLLLPLFLLTLSKKGHSKLASLTLLTLLFFGIVQSSLKQGAISPMIVVSYALIIFMSGILISPGSIIVSMGIIFLTMTIIFYLQCKQIVVTDYSWRKEPVEIIDILVINFLYLVIASVSWLSSKEIVKSFKRIKVSELRASRLAKKLENQNNNLENIIDKRTKELRENQLKQLTEMSNLAEFGLLSAGLLHDIKNPLTVIAMNLDSLNEPTEVIPQLKKLNLNNLVKKSLMASKMVESIIKSSQRQLVDKEVKEWFDLKKVIKNALLILNSRANKLGIKIIFESPKLRELYGYPIKLSRIVANLVMNSMDALEIIKRDKPLIKIVVENHNKFIKIKVIDNGIGIKKEDGEKIFTASFTTKKSNRLAGLGLYISQQILKKYLLGKITFKSTYGLGTEFILQIPIKNNENTSRNK